MKIILLVAVIVLSSIDARPYQDMAGFSIESTMSCWTEAKLSMDDFTGFGTISMDNSMSAKEQKFVCCITKPMISNGQLETSELQSYASSIGATIDVESIVKSCEKNGVYSWYLHSCDDISAFFTCVISKI